MGDFDLSRAKCWVFTFKQGLLSNVAHDLRLSVARFSLAVDREAGTVSADFDASSLLVETALKDGRDHPALSEADKSKIAEQIREQVLQAERYPTISFRGYALTARTDGGYDVSGQLSLHGVTRALSATTRLIEGRQELELSLNQPDFGIEPYRALLGALKLQREVRVRLVVPQRA